MAQVVVNAKGKRGPRKRYIPKKTNSVTVVAPKGDTVMVTPRKNGTGGRPGQKQGPSRSTGARQAIAKSKRSRAQAAVQRNKYAHELLDPCSTAPESYPDEYTGPSACFHSKLNVPIPYPLLLESSGDSVVEAGKYHVSFRPEMEEPIVYLDDVITTGPNYTGTITKNTAHEGLFELQNYDTDASNVGVESEVDKPLILEPSKWYNVVMKLQTDGAQGVAKDCYMFKGQDATNSQTFFGIPYDSGAGSDNKLVVNTLTLGTGAAGTLHVRMVSEQGPVAEVTAVQTIGQQIFSPTKANCVVEPGVGWQIQVTGATGQVILASIQLIYKQATVLAGYLRVWKSLKIPDLDGAKAIYDKYRVVAGSVLIQYRGATLNNAGTAAGLFSGGGPPPSYVRMDKWENIADVPYEQDNPLWQGSYGWWKPTHSTDMAFRDLDKHVSYLMPHLLFSGVVAGDGNNIAAGQLRLRCDIHFECTSSSAIVPLKPSRVDFRGEIPRMEQMLKGFPNVMENPLHLGKIGDFLKKAIKGTFQAGHKAYEFYDKNRTWLTPLMTVASEAAMAL